MTTKPARIIKRYQNRKLYDTTDSCYVTLEDIGELVRQGEDVQVIDNTSKEDLTSVTLSQIIFEEEKKQKSALPLATLTNLVRSSGETIRGLASRALESGVREVENVWNEVHDLVERLVSRGQITAEARNDLLGIIQKLVGNKLRPPKSPAQTGMAQTEIQALRSRIEELERRLQSQDPRNPKVPPNPHD